MKFTFKNAIFTSDTLLFWTMLLPSRQLRAEHVAGGHSSVAEGAVSELISIMHPDDLPMMERALDEAAAGRAPLNHEFRILGPGGQLHWLYVAGHQSHGCDGQLSGTALNITQKKQAAAQLMEREAQLRAVIEQGQIGIYIKDLQGNFLLANRYMEELAQVRGASLQGRHQREVLTAQEQQEVWDIDEKVIRSRQPQSFDWTFRRDGQSMSFHMNVTPYLQAGELAGVVGFVHDVTVRKAQEEALAELTHSLEAKVASRTRELEVLNARLLQASLHDALTGLPNRTQLAQRLEHLIGQPCDPQRDPQHPGFAVLFIDLNKFKSVNDNLGHAAGDELLLQVGERLSALPAEHFMVARLGGDEFVLLLEQVADREAALEVAEQVQAMFQPPFKVSGQELLMSASIGVTLGDQQDHSAEAFLQRADIAMYRAKTSNSRHYQLFEPGMRVRRQMLVGLQQDIKHAVRRGELFVEYHPIVTLPERKIAGIEALVRWQHPVHGLIAPNEFIPIAEEAGVVQDIDMWVFRHSCRLTAEYARTGRLYKMGFNLSARNFEQPNLLETLTAILHEENFPPEHLAIEVTESILVQNFRQVSQILWELRRMGVMIAADDFGTGYSSLSYLHRLPFSNLKLDRSFIASAEHAAAFLRPVKELADLLEMRVIAEGVESEAQAEVLTGLGCEFAQGYLFYQPLSAHEVLGLLNQPKVLYQPPAS